MFFCADSLAGTIAYTIENGIPEPTSYATAGGIAAFAVLIIYLLTRKRRESY